MMVANDAQESKMAGEEVLLEEHQSTSTSSRRRTTKSSEAGSVDTATLKELLGDNYEDSNPTGLSEEEANTAISKYGYNEVVIKEKPVILQILSRYLGIVPLFMTITAVLSAAIKSKCAEDPNLDPCACRNLNDWASFVLLIVELNLVVYADYTGSKSSGDAIKKLQEASASKVGVMRNKEWKQLPTRELVPGDLVAVTIGMTIPADGIVVSQGEPLKLDYSSLTGEPLPEKKGYGQTVLSGAVVLVGESEMIVSKTGSDSSLGTTQALIAEAKSEKETGGEMASILGTVAIFLACYGVVASIIIGSYTGVAFDADAGESIKLAFVILSTILPVTMPLVLTTTLAVGSQELANDDAVVQRFSAIPEMAGMDILCSDKTGTLTLGKMSVIEEESLTFHDDVTVKEMLELALVCSRIEHSDAIDAAITKYHDDPSSTLDDYEIKKFIPFDPSTKKVTAVATRKSSNESIVVVKGAPPVLMTFEGVKKVTYEAAKDALDERSARGYKTLGVCIQKDEFNWKLLGFISILDPPRSDTAHTVAKCNELGVEVKMITGDQRLIAVEVAKQLGLPNTMIFEKDVFQPNNHIVNQAGGFANLCAKAGGFAGVSPEHKHRVVTALQGRGHFVGMTGDGVNDAPALSIANVGIAVADATDAARGASDIVLQQEGLSTIVKALYGSRKIFKRIETYLTYRMCSSFTFGLAFVLIYCASEYNFPTWTLILMSLLNDFAVTSSSKDNVMIQKTPQSLNIWKVGTTSAIMAFISSVQVFCFVNSAINFNADDDGSHFWGLKPHAPSKKDNTGSFTGCEIAGITFLVMIITLQCDLIVSRSPKPFFMFSTKKDDQGYFTSVPPPSWQVLVAVGVSLTIATFIAVYWDAGIAVGSGYGMEGIGWRNAGLVWAWAIMWFIITDLCQSATVVLLDRYERDPASGLKNFYKNIFEQDWESNDDATAHRKAKVDEMRHDLVSYDKSVEDSVRSGVLSIGTTGSRRSTGLHVGLAAIAESDDDDLAPLTHQHALLAIETLRNDDDLLRVISTMASQIAGLTAQVNELKSKVE